MRKRTLTLTRSLVKHTERLFNRSYSSLELR